MRHVCIVRSFPPLGDVLDLECRTDAIFSRFKNLNIYKKRNIFGVGLLFAKEGARLLTEGLSSDVGNIPFLQNKYR
jgi:hypothetical protein